ncbi:MAG: alpha/beta hydrolase [Campylobacterales bacterium]|nr:alpha/beta hydrolase [Campylobacterales bacterium]
MRKVLILHGWHASPPPHWQDWLARELVSRGVIVAFVQLSNPMNPSLALWLREAAEALAALRPDTVVCHSLGNVLWWHLCHTQRALHVESLLMVAPPRDLSDYEAVAEFFPVALPQELYATESLLVTSEDDPYLNKAEALRFARALGVKHISFQNMGHINAASGYGPWPWMLEQVMAQGGHRDS